MDSRLDYMAPYCGFYCAESDYLVTAAFNPWTGKKIQSGFKSFFIGVLANDFQNKEHGNERAIRQKVLQNIENWQSMHKSNNVCSRLYDLTIGDDCNSTRAFYLPIIRAYAVCDKVEAIHYDFMDYCPFCGAKLPSRLDEELTRILRDEYGLESWKDYKKAPHEFHTDEWWKKRRL